MQFVISYFKGLLLGGGVCFISFLIDTSLCKDTYLKINQKNQKLYLESLDANIKNMIIIAPITYSIIDNTLINKTTIQLNFLKLNELLLIHNFLYFIVHFFMHKPFLYKIHKFHHKFDDILLPSFGNAVSLEEFFLAYMFPFITGAYLVKPNELTFMSSIAIIAILNMVIHTQELENVKWINFLVSPNQHIHHHRVKTKHYAAPLLNLDYFIENVNKILKRN
jgi:hypothetical protein